MMNIFDRMKLQKIEVEYEFKKLLLGYLVQTSTLSVLIVILVMCNNVVTVFDQYYHENIADFYNITVENIEYKDILFLEKRGYDEMYMYMPDLDEEAIFYQNGMIDFVCVNFICDERVFEELGSVAGREYTVADNLEGKHVAWITENAAIKYQIDVGDTIEYHMNNDLILPCVVEGILDCGDCDSVYIPVNTLIKEKNEKQYNIKCCLSTKTKDIANYDFIKLYLGCQRKYMYFDELDYIFSVLFFIKSIFIGLSIIGIILCFISITNICGLHISGRQDCIRMLFQLGMDTRSIKKIYSGIYIWSGVIAFVSSIAMAKYYVVYINSLIMERFGSTGIEINCIIPISIVLGGIILFGTKVIVSKSFHQVGVLDKIEGITK